MRRRGLVRKAGLGIMIVTVGCSSGGDSSTATTPNKASRSPTPSPTPTKTEVPTPTGKIEEVTVDENREVGLNPIEFHIRIGDSDTIGNAEIRVTVKSDAGTKTKSAGIMGDEQEITITPADGTSTDGTTIEWTVELVKEGKVVDTKSGREDYE